MSTQEMLLEKEGWILKSVAVVVVVVVVFIVVAVFVAVTVEFI